MIILFKLQWNLEVKDLNPVRLRIKGQFYKFFIYYGNLY
jgi:hypothetical protein